MKSFFSLGMESKLFIESGFTILYGGVFGPRRKFVYFACLLGGQVGKLHAGDPEGWSSK
jgi:hypothetical protein